MATTQRRAQARRVEIQDLVDAVARHCGDEHIVSSGTVRFDFEDRGLDAGERRGGRSVEWNGRPFQSADNRACSDGLLLKWRRRGQVGVGWSLAGGEPLRLARQWASRHGWERA